MTRAIRFLLLTVLAMSALTGLTVTTLAQSATPTDAYKIQETRLGPIDAEELYPVERILEVNALQQVTKTVVEAARESLVIGEV